jgi:uncharacterized membrane protein
MRPSLWLFLARTSICVALAASAALYVHYLDPADSSFCGLQSGCEAARKSGFSYFFGSRFVSLPLFALVAFGGLLGLSLSCEAPRHAAGSPSGGWSSLWHRPALLLFAASGIGAAVALILVAYQAFVLEAYCWLCLVVDAAAIFTAAASFFLARAARDLGPVHTALTPGAWLGFGALAILAPLSWSWLKPAPPLPPAIEALYVPGKLNVVEFLDFECPHCRRLHATLRPLLAEYGDRVHFVRQHRPLPQHEHAEHAARAAICADAQGQGDAMADLLFSIELSPESINKSAEALRLDPLRFDTCINSDLPTATLAEHAARLPDEELEGLPTTYVGTKRLLGVPSGAALRDAFERAGGEPPFAPSGPLFSLGVLALVALIGVFGRRSAPHGP